MVSEANEPGSESGKRSDDRRAVPEGTAQEGGASTPLAVPGSFAAAAMVYPDSLLDPELEREAPRQTLEDRRMQGVHLLVGQRPVGGAIGDGVGQALLPRRDRRAAIAVEQAHHLDVRVLQRPYLLEDVTGPKGLVDHHGEVTGDGGESRQRPQREAARNIVSEFREVKLGHPHFPWKISGLRDRGVEGAGHPEGRAAELDERRLAGMERVDLPRRPPAHPLPVQAERREEAAEDALQVEEVDRRPAALDPAWRPGTGQQQRDRARLLAGAVGVEAVALAELEGADEGGPQRQVQAERAHQAGERRAPELAGLGGERVLHRERYERTADEAREAPVRLRVGEGDGHHLGEARGDERPPHAGREPPLRRVLAGGERYLGEGDRDAIVAAHARDFLDQVLLETEIPTKRRRRDHERVALRAAGGAERAQAARDLAAREPRTEELHHAPRAEPERRRRQRLRPRSILHAARP